MVAQAGFSTRQRFNPLTPVVRSARLPIPTSFVSYTEPWFLTAPSLGTQVVLAALDGEIDGPVVGLRSLDALDTVRFQAARAVRAHLAVAGRRAESAAAYRVAIGLTSESTVVEYLIKCLRDANI